MHLFDIKKVKILFSYDFKRIFFKPQIYIALAIALGIISINFFSIVFSYEQNIYKYNLGEVGANMVPVLNSHFFMSLLIYILLIPYISGLIVSNEKSKGFYGYLNVSHVSSLSLLASKSLIYLCFGFLYFIVILLYPLILTLIIEVNPLEIVVSAMGLLGILLIINSLSFLSAFLMKRKITSIFLFYGIISSFYYLESSINHINHFPTEMLLKKFSLFGNFFNFQLGLLSVSSVVLYLGIFGLATFLTYMLMNLKQYKVSND